MRSIYHLTQKQGCFIFALLGMCIAGAAVAQDQAPRCGVSAILERRPELKQALHEDRPLQYKSNQTTETDHSIQHPIPVVFHILLTEKQIQQIGGAEGIKQRVQSQIEAINQDFNRENADSSLIPPAFKPYYGNAGIRFAPARTAPTGASTEGYQIKTITKNGFELYNDYKSGVGFTDAKYAEAGGLDAWDPTAYINVWVIYPVENGAASRLGGLTIPPSYIGPQYNIPLEEQGIMLHYGVFGKRRNTSEYYLPGATMGRTLTHELGHFFNLRHVWGDDNGACPGEPGSEDDGVSDTPPQGRETYGDPRFPLYDSCTTTGNGIMYMNFMDYTNDRSKQMFTTEQAVRMQHEVLQGGISYSLTRQPQLLEYGTGKKTNITFYPNPAREYVQVFFETNPDDLKGITMHNAFGQMVYSREIPDKPLSYYNIPTTGFASGIYFLKFHFSGTSEVRQLHIIR